MVTNVATPVRLAMSTQMCCGVALRPNTALHLLQVTRRRNQTHTTPQPVLSSPSASSRGASVRLPTLQGSQYIRREEGMMGAVQQFFLYLVFPVWCFTSFFILFSLHDESSPNPDNINLRSRSQLDQGRNRTQGQAQPFNF